MNKCNFCIKSSPNGKCMYSLQSSREKYCEQAIKNMIKALQKTGGKIKDE